MKKNESLVKGNKIYIANAYDKIDCALSLFINEQYSCGKNLKVSFIRESEGIYRFGKRRVILKFDKSKQ